MAGDILRTLRDSTINKKPITLLKENGEELEGNKVKDAKMVKFEGIGEPVPLNTITNFYNEDKPQDLRAVLFCWLHDKSSIVDYRNECIEYGIADFKFLVKTELNTWLNGNSDSCAFIKEYGEKETEKATSEEKQESQEDPVETKRRKLEDEQVNRILSHEKDLVDHNVVLRGSKNIDFGYLLSDARRFISHLKKAKPSSLRHDSSRRDVDKTPKKQPIIIISPATTSLLSLNNVKQFLEEGVFVDPTVSTVPKPSSGIVSITHKSDKLIHTAQKLMVVDSVDIFTKPEYWDRVVAIFTTGQTWQFSRYKYTKPEVLFQRYPGFFLGYQGDVTPKQIKEWNVTELRVDRGEKRFRDKMVVRDFWTIIEKALIARGYGK